MDINFTGIKNVSGYKGSLKSLLLSFDDVEPASYSIKAALTDNEHGNHLSEFKKVATDFYEKEKAKNPINPIDYLNKQHADDLEITYDPTYKMYQVNGKIFYLLEESTIPFFKFIIKFVDLVVENQKRIPNIKNNVIELQTLKYAENIKKELEKTVYKYFD